jgi:hypothetical protein
VSEKARESRSETRVRRVCSWCAGVLETSYTPWTGQAEMTTHGVCRSCLVEIRLRQQLARADLGSGYAGVAAGA